MTAALPDIGMAEAFGRDPLLEQAVRDLVAKYGVRVICETGSWRGWTTKRMSEFVKYVITIDSDEELYEWTMRTTEKCPNVESYLGNSPEVLRTLIPQFNRHAPTLYYLDAHNSTYSPILEEISVIAELDAAPILVIHDVQVPDRPDFGFDVYNGVPLTFEYVKPALDKLRFPWKHSFNREVHPDSHRRGALFITPVA